MIQKKEKKGFDDRENTDFFYCFWEGIKKLEKVRWERSFILFLKKSLKDLKSYNLKLNVIFAKTARNPQTHPRAKTFPPQHT